MMNRRRSAAVTLAAAALTASLLSSLTPALATHPDGGGDARSLVFTTEPLDASGGTPFGRQPVVEVRGDSFGGPADWDKPVVLSIVQETAEPLEATLTCDPVVPVDGVATFSGCSIDRQGRYRLQASSDGLTPGRSGDFFVHAGPPAKLSFRTPPPPSISAGAPLDPPPAFEVTDAGGNPAFPEHYALGLVAVDADDLPLTLHGCTGGETVDDQGAAFYKVPVEEFLVVDDFDRFGATFRHCSLNEAGEGYRLLAVAVPEPDFEDELETLVGTSEPFTVLAGEATQLGFVAHPSGGTPGGALSRQPIVAIQDDIGNTVSSASATVALSLTGPRGTLACTPSNSIETAGGLASFEECSIDELGEFTLTATAAGYPPVTSSAIGIVRGAPAQLRFRTQPGDGTAGSPLATQPVVEILDEDGATASGQVALSIEGDPTETTVSCPNETAPAGLGVATFVGCSIDRPGTYRLLATEPDTGLTATSNEFTITVGNAVGVAITQSPTTHMFAGDSFPVTVELQDAGGNVDTAFGDEVRLALAPTGEFAAGLTCDGGTSATAASGVARFTACAVDGEGEQRLVAVAGPGVAMSGPFVVLRGPPASVAFLSAPTAAINGGLLATPRVLVRDAGGNIVPDTFVDLSVDGGSLDGCDPSARTVVEGTAAFPGCTLHSTNPTVTLTATARDENGSVAVGRSVVVPVSQDPPVGAAPVGMSLEETFGGSRYANNPSFVTNNVNSATGTLNLSSDDLTVAGIGIPFNLVRTYNSADGPGGLFGPGWSSVFDAGVTLNEDGTATVRGEDGQRVMFQPNPECTGKGRRGARICTLIAPAGAQSTLTCRATRCTVTRFDGVTMTSVDGRIQSLEARSGHGLRFDYDDDGTLTGVTPTTSGENPLTVAVAVENGRVTRVQTPTRTVGYGYSPDGLLTSYTDATGNTTTYDHDSAGRLVNEQLGEVALSVTYGQDGRVASATRSGSPRHFVDTYEWAVDPDTGIGTSTRLTSLTPPFETRPRTGTYISQHRGNVLLTEQLPEGATTAYSFDTALNLVAFQDPLGEVQRMTYSSAGDLVTQTAPDGGTVTLTYNASHQPVSVTDAAGNTTAYTYAGGNLTWVIPPDPADPAALPGDREQLGTHFAHDDFAQVVKVETPRSVRAFTYDEFGNETSFQVFDRADTELSNPLNGMGPRSTHDEAGNVVSVVDPRGRRSDGSVDPAFETTFTYDGLGRVTALTEPGGRTTETTYTPAGEIASLTEPDGTVTTYTWDEPNLARTAVTPTGDSVWTFDEAGNVVAHNDVALRATTSVYDTSGRLIEQTDPANVTTRFWHNAMGAVVAMTDSTGRTAETAYDAQNRVTRLTINGIVESRRTYDSAGNLVSDVDASGHVTSYAYNNHGLLGSVTTAAGTTSYGYDADDNLATVTDGNGNTTAYTYDGAGQRTSQVIAGRTWAYDYDVAGNLVSTSDPDGRTSAFTVDASNRRTRIVHAQAGQPSVEIVQEFDLQGRRRMMSDPTGTHTFDYDDLGRMTSASSPTGSFTYDYSVPGEMTETYPDGTGVTYQYDDARHVMRVTAPGVDVAYTRNAARQITGITTGNGLVETRGYDDADRLVNQRLACGARTEMVTRYGYDANSNPLGWEQVVDTQTTTASYGYDDTGRLVGDDLASSGFLEFPGRNCTAGDPSPAPQRHAAGGPLPAPPMHVNDPDPGDGLSDLAPAAANMSYDAVGNRLSAGDATFSYDDADQLVSGSDGRQATYDGAGNLTSSTLAGRTTTYGYDATGRLAELTMPDGRVISYAYDGDGNRVAKSVDGALSTTYAWDRSGNLPLLALETDADGEFRRYFYGSGPVAVQTATATFYLHADRRGNIVGLTDEQGRIVGTYAYDGFGSSSARGVFEDVNPLRFGGQYLDGDTGLYHLRARYYDPSIGRFTQRDPVPSPVGTPALSSYAYAGNQPTVLSDPSGRIPHPFEPTGHSSDESNWVALVGRSVAAGSGAGNVAIKVGVKVASLPADEVAALGKATSSAGIALSVVGIGLSAYVAYDDCENGTPYQCAGSSVALAFNVGCLGLTVAGTGGAASLGCSVLGAGLSLVISTYGPDIAAFGLTVANGFAVGVELGAGALYDPATDASLVLGTALHDAATLLDGTVRDIATSYERLGSVIGSAFVHHAGTFATGLNRLESAISSGYRDAVDVLVQAGVEASRIAAILKESYTLAAEDVVGELEALGYAVEDIALALAEAFTATARLTARMLHDVGYIAERAAIGTELAFNRVAGWSEEALADALVAAGYPLDEVTSGLRSAYAASAEATAEVLQALNHTADDVASAIRDVYSLPTQEVVAVLDAVDYTATEIAVALERVYGFAARPIGSMLHDLGFGPEAVGIGLRAAFAGVGTTDLAKVLAEVGFAVDEVARALDSAFSITTEQLTRALRNTLLYTVDEIAGALKTAFGTTATEVASILGSIGLPTGEIADVLVSVYKLTAGGLKRALGSASSTLGGFFSVDTLEDVGRTLNPENWF